MNQGFTPVVATPKSKQPQNPPQPISMQELQGSLSSYFDDVPDPRVNRTKHHLLKDILVMARLKSLAYKTGQTIYQIKHGLLSNYLIEQLKRPDVSMFIV